MIGIAKAPGTWNLISDNTLGAYPSAAHQRLYDRPDPNTLTEMSMTLEMAHDMWAAKWGWDWIALEMLQDTAGLNWGRLADRLQRMSLMEHFPETGAYKLVPKTWK